MQNRHAHFNTAPRCSQLRRRAARLISSPYVANFMAIIATWIDRDGESRPSPGEADSSQEVDLVMTMPICLSRKLALASWSCSCFSKLSDGVDAPQKPQIID